MYMYVLYMYIYTYTYTYIFTYTYIYIYIYREREREREKTIIYCNNNCTIVVCWYAPLRPAFTCCPCSRSRTWGGRGVSVLTIDISRYCLFNY